MRFIPGMAIIAVAGLLSGGCAFEPYVSHDFEGIKPTLAKLPSVAQGKSGMMDVPRIFVVHGINHHCVGYAEDLAHALAERMQLRIDGEYARPQQGCSGDRVLEARQTDECLNTDCRVMEGATGHAAGYIRRRAMYAADAPKGAQPSLYLYELTWSPSTLWAKQEMLSADGLRHLPPPEGFKPPDEAKYMREKGLSLNRELKETLLNEGLSDAVLYIGKYKPHMLHPVYQGICFLMHDRRWEETARQKVAVCNAGDLVKDVIAETAAAPARSESVVAKNVFFITHSLGSRMTYDAFALAAQRAVNHTVGKPYESADKNDSFMTSLLLTKVAGIYMFANQLPLLALGEFDTPNAVPAFGLAAGIAAAPQQLEKMSNVVEKATSAEAKRVESAPRRVDRLAAKVQASDLRQQAAAAGSIARAAEAKKGQAVEIVAISDPDDLLTYAIQSRGDGGTSMVNVVTRVSATRLPLINAGSAHTNHINQPFVRDLVACGGEHATNSAKRC